jgi:O-antigen ligase
MVLAALLTLRLTGPELAARYSSAFAESDERDESADSRVALWRDCLKVASDRPLFGVGPRNWPVVASEYGWPPGKEAHSTWMQTAAEMGYPGALAMFLFFAVAAARLWPMANRMPKDDNRHLVTVARATVMSVAGFVVAGQFVTLPGLEIPYYIVMIGAVVLKDLPVAAAARREARPQAADRIGPRPAPPLEPSPTGPARSPAHRT